MTRPPCAACAETARPVLPGPFRPRRKRLEMKILLTALNSQYVHSNPAIRYIYTVMADTPDEVKIREFTINNDPAYIFGELVRANCDMVCFSCYVWNIEQIKALGSDLKKACPRVRICLGGPEVSAEAHIFARENPWVDYIICGEGEYSFYRLAEVLRAEDGRDGADGLMTVPGLVYRHEGRIYINPQMEPMDFNAIPFLYSLLPCEEDKVIYYESARGCPFRCSYCLSCIDKSVRPLALERVKRDLRYFLYKKVMQVKFVDRTFNYDEKRACEIVSFILANDNGVTNFHFEICADLVSQRLYELLAKARPGLFQLEIGIQSANPDTLRAVDRNENVYPVLYNAERLAALPNVHVHVDLIAGLPFETYEIFRRSFNKVYDLGAEAFQLGFLKVLRGAPLAAEKSDYGIVCRDRAPYEIIADNWMTAEELVRLKTIENVLNIYYNRGGFGRTLALLRQRLALTPFDLFERLAGFYYDGGFQHKNRKKEEQYRIMRRFALGCGLTADEAEEALTADLRAAFKPEEAERFLKKGWEI